jgi:hypothetical protein
MDVEAEMRHQLKIQAQAHSDHLADVLAVKEKELERHFKKIHNERLEQEQSAYKMQIGAMLGRLRGIDDALKCNTNVIVRTFYFIGQYSNFGCAVRYVAMNCLHQNVLSRDE